MVETIFDACVNILLILGRATGLGYEGINVVLFVFLLPAVMVGMAMRIYYLEKRVPDATDTMGALMEAGTPFLFAAILILTLFLI